MKLKNIAKASLALGILTTEMITTTAQPVKADEASSRLSVTSKDTQNLKTYYTGSSFDLRGLSGYKEGDKVIFPQNGQQIDVTLTGKEGDVVQSNDDVTNVDVFAVPEGTGRSAIMTTIGGITTPNTQSYKDTTNNVNLRVSKSTSPNTISVSVKNYDIFKEKISLKELDFKLRKHLIDNHDLYKTEPKDSKIRINMKDGGYYTFELNKKLQTHRMGDVIDGTKIKEINVELN
ncbi:TPA: superantigen-like protein [Staphylococcus aureus]|nr:superantigen-like protein [Staphylococcus aureus]